VWFFYCGLTETTQTYNCTDLDNNQGLLKALNDEARETVKSLLTHPRNVDTVVDQMRFRCIFDMRDRSVTM